MWVFQPGSYLIWNWNMFAVFRCGKINYHLCFKISSRRKPSHENVEVTSLTANKRGFQLEKGANRNKCLRIVFLICSWAKKKKNDIWYWLTYLKGRGRAMFWLGCYTQQEEFWAPPQSYSRLSHFQVLRCSCSLPPSRYRGTLSDNSLRQRN